MFVGVTVDPLMLAERKLTGKDFARYDVVRFPVWADQRVSIYQRFSEQLQDEGVRPLIVYDHRTISSPTNLSYARRFTRLRKLFPGVQYHQIGNESDQPNSESSSTLPAERCRHLLRSAEQALGDLTLIGPGLVSGNPAYLEEIAPALDAFHAWGVHPYGQYPRSWGPGHGFGYVTDLLNAYRRVLPGKAIWLTEFGLPDHEAESAAQRQRYHVDMLNEFDRYGVETALVFCAACGVEGFDVMGKVAF
jgi:hypothetical protein